MTPIEYYKQKCNEGLIFEDPQQFAALTVLQQVYSDLINEQAQRNHWLAFLRKPILIKGVYLWGGVGIGKTLMMDCFFHCLPFKNKLRIHFHEFMQSIHNKLTLYQGKQDPLKIVAEDIAKENCVICFDELYVSDITDAMLLKRLFDGLFARGVCLVATSNTPPDDLYKNGLQRLQFLPAIALIKTNTQVIHIPTTIDYRLRHLKEAGVFYTPLDAASAQNMEQTFNVLAEGKKIITEPLDIFGRKIKIKQRTDNIVWFDFAEICSVPRSQKDFLAIAKLFRTVFISDIPIIDPNAKDTICLFISLVDVFYDAGIRLVLSAAEPVQDIYSRGYMISEYTRTGSRLQEMQSIDYFTGEFDWKH